MLLLLLAALAGAAQAQCWPCASTGLVTRFDNVLQCCRVCSAGFACNGTAASPCIPPDFFQPAVGQSSCRVPRACAPDTFQTSAPTATTDRVCRALSQCAAGTEFERIAPTATTDRVCTLLRVCNYTLEYELKPPTATSDRVCRAVGLCNLITEQVAVAPTTTSDTVCRCRPNFIGTPCSLCENMLPGCNLCTQNYSVSDAAICTECLLAFQPVATAQGLRCVRCETEGCAECNELNACIRCREGFKLDETGKCVCDLAGCAVCSVNGTCDTCMQGYQRVSEIKCDLPTTSSTTTTTSQSSSATTTSSSTLTAAPPSSTTATDVNVTAAATNLSAQSSNLLTIAIVGASVGSLAMVAVIAIVATKTRKRRSQRRTHESDARLTVLPNSAYVVPRAVYSEPVHLYEKPITVAVEEPLYDIATNLQEGEYLNIES